MKVLQPKITNAPPGQDVYQPEWWLEDSDGMVRLCTKTPDGYTQVVAGVGLHGEKQRFIAFHVHGLEPVLHLNDDRAFTPLPK